MRMEVIPIHEIKITATGMKPTGPSSCRASEPLTITQTARGAEVTVPKLRTHAMVVFE